MSIEIYTRKAFMFVQPVTAGDKAAEKDPKRFVRTQADSFTVVPDWVKNDNMYKWGLADGDIKVVAAAATGTGTDTAEAASTGAEGTSEQTSTEGTAKTGKKKTEG
jgi:hypothetical protein